MFNLTINDFSGPLDLLLHLVKCEKLDIYEVDITKIIDSYLEFINKVDQYDLDQKSEYLVMASELIHLKSRMLVNDTLYEEDDYEFNTEEDLKQKLIEYELYKNVVDDLKILEETRLQYYTKEPTNLSEYKEQEPMDLDIFELINAMSLYQKRKEYEKPVETKITKKELNVEDKINYIKTKLKNTKKLEFKILFDYSSKEDLIITFLSILNMSKNREINIYQENNFKDIFIEGVYE